MICQVLLNSVRLSLRLHVSHISVSLRAECNTSRQWPHQANEFYKSHSERKVEQILNVQTTFILVSTLINNIKLHVTFLLSPPKYHVILDTL